MELNTCKVSRNFRLTKANKSGDSILSEEGYLL